MGILCLITVFLAFRAYSSAGGGAFEHKGDAPLPKAKKKRASLVKREAVRQCRKGYCASTQVNRLKSLGIRAIRKPKSLHKEEYDIVLQNKRRIGEIRIFVDKVN